MRAVKSVLTAAANLKVMRALNGNLHIMKSIQRRRLPVWLRIIDVHNNTDLTIIEGTACAYWCPMLMALWLIEKNCRLLIWRLLRAQLKLACFHQTKSVVELLFSFILRL